MNHGSRSGRFHLVLPVALGAAHLAAVLHFVITPAQVVSTDPPLSYDYSLHFQQVHAVTAFLSHGRWHGYDPFFMGGYHKANLFNVDAKAWALFTHLAGPCLPKPVAFKLFIPVLLFWIPMLAYGACRIIRLTPWSSLIAAAFSVAYFWIGEPFILTRWGLLSYVWLAAAAPLLGSAMLASASGRRATLGTGLFAAWCFLLHALAPIIMLPSAAALLCVHRPRRVMAARLVLIALLALTLNLPWVAPFLANFARLTSSAHAFTLQNHDPLLCISYFLHPGTVWLLLPCALAVLGVLELTGRDQRRPAVVLAAGPLCFLLLAFFGSFWSVTARLQPMRFLAAAFWGTAPLLALGVERLDRGLPRHGVFRAGAVAAAIMTAGVAILTAAPPSSDTTLDPSGACISTTLPHHLQALVQWIESSTTPAARLLMEDSGTLSGHRYNGVYLPGLIPYFTGRSLIGGPWPYMFIAEHVTDFHEGLLFNAPIEGYTKGQFSMVAELYNLGWAVCWSESATRYFDSFGDWITPVASFGRFRAYRFLRGYSFIINGSGDVQFEFDRITVRNAATQESGLLVSLHHAPGLYSSSGELSAVTVPGVPRSFTLVRGAEPRFTIRFGRPESHRMAAGNR
ncbi:hypothetical protein JW905_19145 [bacterium]|nr:hypothetical protein [candidate division CSSED10-310 bacterium]